MTDGILLTEIAHDRLLRRYDTIIIDEAHERSLNIDLLLGYLAQLLPRRPDLKVIITSATIDTERFAAPLPGCLGPGQTGADHRGVGPQLSGRAALPAAGTTPTAVSSTSRRPIVEAVRELVRRRPGRHPGVLLR